MRFILRSDIAREHPIEKRRDVRLSPSCKAAEVLSWAASIILSQTCHSVPGSQHCWRRAGSSSIIRRFLSWWEEVPIYFLPKTLMSLQIQHEGTKKLSSDAPSPSESRERSFFLIYFCRQRLVYPKGRLMTSEHDLSGNLEVKSRRRITLSSRSATGQDQH